MRRTSWLPILAVGLLTGVVWFLLSTAALLLLATEFAAFARQGGPLPRAGGAYFFAIDLLMGVWAIWLYSVLAQRYGAGSATAAIAGTAWWVIKSLQSAKWVGMGFAPVDIVLAPLATTLVAAMGASVAGAWLFERAAHSRSATP